MNSRPIPHPPQSHDPSKETLIGDAMVSLRQRIVHYATSWLGTPYHHAARTRGVGVDCALLLCEVYHAVGIIPYIDPRPYPPDWHLHRQSERYLTWIKKYAQPSTHPLMGDIIIWRFGRCYSHAAIITDSCEGAINPSIHPIPIIHACLGQGCVRAHTHQIELSSRPYQLYTLLA